jgi:GNAT superfamily N-acetyltransferase
MSAERHADGLSIRPATRADVPLILSFINELAEYERLAHAVVATRAALDRHLFPASPARPAAEALIGEVADGDGRGRIAAGFALYFPTFSTFLASPGLYLEDLYVRPAHRGKGLGAALLRRLAAIAVERGCGRLEWAVLDWNAPAIGFYKRLGAAAMDEWTVFRLTGRALEDTALGAGA